VLAELAIGIPGLALAVGLEGERIDQRWAALMELDKQQRLENL
jgi:hypothetical protein